LVKVFHLR